MVSKRHTSHNAAHVCYHTIHFLINSYVHDVPGNETYINVVFEDRQLDLIARHMAVGQRPTFLSASSLSRPGSQSGSLIG